MLCCPQYRQTEANLAVELAAKRVEVLERAAAFEPVAAQLTQARSSLDTVNNPLCAGMVCQSESSDGIWFSYDAL